MIMMKSVPISTRIVTNYAIKHCEFDRKSMAIETTRSGFLKGGKVIVEQILAS